MESHATNISPVNWKYVRIFNGHGQPIDLDGKPSGNPQTHIPIKPDGSFPLPKGWKP